MAAMEVKTRQKGEVLLVEIRGRVGINETPLLKQELEKLFEQEKSLVVNLASIQYIDSSCLGALITVRKELEKKGLHLRLAEPSDIVRDVLNLTKLESFFEVSETEEEALQQLRQL
ncbi:MAG: STAS domain-containing protein [bacterium]|nr:STAS domain-containing protein [bacterium]